MSGKTQIEFAFEFTRSVITEVLYRKHRNWWQTCKKAKLR